MTNVKIAPSILSADFSKMGDELESISSASADMAHCDVMDGVFVPNITFGIKMIADLKKHSRIPLDCHLMIVEPWKYVSAFAKAGADFITVHYEACKEKLADTLNLIKSNNCKCGLVINPETSVDCVKDLISQCDIVLVMSVHPGFGGQTFIEDVLDKCKAIRRIIDKSDKNILLEIDGGINKVTATKAKEAGCDVLVAGSYVFGAEDRAEAISSLKKA